jgi:H+/gluconate symporter-like permease
MSDLLQNVFQFLGGFLNVSLLLLIIIIVLIVRQNKKKKPKNQRDSYLDE